MRRSEALQAMPSLMRALGFLQMVEEGLRLYVGTAEEAIAQAVPYGVPFKVDRQEILKASLGTLIRRFKKLSRNDALIARLEELPKHRNFIAHAGFRLAVQGIHDDSIDLDHIKRHALEVGDEAEALMHLVGQEARSILQCFPSLLAMRTDAA